MSLIKNAELYYPKLNPKRPNTKFNAENPTWEVQIRTTSKEQKAEWLALDLVVKDIIPDEGMPYYRVNLKRKSIKETGEKSDPVSVVDGSLNPMNPDAIGNGSIGNIRVFQYEYVKNNQKNIASVLMGIQVTKLVSYNWTDRDDDFEETEMEIINSGQSEESEDF
jgi:hypothetical protein